MAYKMGKRVLESSSVGELRATEWKTGNVQMLREHMQEDGYLLLRGLQHRENVERTRAYLLEKLRENGQLSDEAPQNEAVPAHGARGGFLGGNKAVTHSKEFLALVESSEIMGFFGSFLQGDILTFDFKWLRVVVPGDFTGAHYDIVYMGQGTKNLYTCWMPIGDVTLDMGPLAILSGSHSAASFERLRATYGAMDVDRDNVEGHFSNDPLELVERFGGKWLTTEFHAGDVLIFGMFTMHASFNNVSEKFRISTDTRFQRADEPVDPRWVGENPPAHYAWGKTPVESMESARKRWKV